MGLTADQVYAALCLLAKKDGDGLVDPVDLMSHLGVPLGEQDLSDYSAAIAELESRGMLETDAVTLPLISATPSYFYRPATPRIVPGVRARLSVLAV
jgi:hypothetical protein